MKRLFYRWIDRYCVFPRWMAFSHYSARRNQFLFVAFPLNYAVALVWWMNHKWAMHALELSWIEREARARLDHYIASTRGVHRPRRMDDTNTSTIPYHPRQGPRP